MLPAGFRAPAVSAAGEAADPPQVWCPLQIREEMGRGGHWLVVLGRLAPGVTRQGAQAEMATLAAGLAAQHPETQRGWGIRLEGLREATAGEARAPLLLLALSVALVLLIACVNVANLLLARAAARRHEIGVRVALGASAPRLLRQLLTESLLLAAAGGAAGLGLARLALAALPRLAPNALPRQGEVGRHGLGGLDGRALAFTAGVALVAALLFGAVPAWRAAGAAGRLPRGRPGLARRLPAALVVAELALALVLAICAGLLLESFGRLLAVDPGLRPQGVLAVGLDLPAARYAKPYQAAAFFQALAERVAALPGVAGAAAVDVLPFGGGYSCNSFSVSPGEEKPAAEIPCAEYRTVVPGYFRTLGIALVRGRELAPADTAGAAPVAVINETLARGLWPGRDPVGRRLTLGFETTAAHTIVGVVRDVHHFGLAAPAAPEVYVSHLQHPASEMTLVVRARRDPAALLGGVRNAVRQLDARLPVGRVALMDDLIAASVAPPRLRAALLFLFAGLALCLAAVGVSGVVAAAVERRRQEIGVRMALGADRGAVVRLIVGETLVTTAAGLALGLAGAAAATRLLAGLLFGVGTAEPWVYAGSCALLALVAAVAGWIPAERASRMEPVAALAE